MTKNFVSVLFFAFILIFAASARAQTVSGSFTRSVIQRGTAAKATIVLSIPGGLHANSSSPNSEYAIPTRVKVTAPGAKVGAVMYPRGTNRKFDFADAPLNVYENRAVFGFNVAVPANFKGNVVKVRAVVSYQTCSNEVCFPPKSQEVTLTAKVK